MEVSFSLKIRPFSINSMYYASKKVLTRDARDWQLSVLSHIKQFGPDLKKFYDEFDEKKHGIELFLTFHTPNFYTEKGTISAHSMDLSNVEKPLIDLLFLPRFHGNSPPHRVQNLNLDDRYIVCLTSKKCYDTDFSVDVLLRLVEQDYSKPAVVLANP